MREAAANRYTSVAIILHWIMAVSFLLMLGSGFVMENVEIAKSLKFNMFQWHKSLGLLLLAAFVLRLIWRLLHKPPAYKFHMPRWEAIAAKGGHVLLYVLMFIMPLSGWIMVSSSSYGLPTIIFGLFEWPHIPKIAGNDAINGASREVHTILAIIVALVIAGHVAAVIKHYVMDKQNLLTRMWWSKKEQ